MKISVEQLSTYLLKDVALLDVRAPVEFGEGHIPGAQNIPLLNDQERRQVGITYKDNGQEAAIALGNRLVSGEAKAQRLEKWLQFFKSHPQGLLYCFRGGLRSQTVQAWLKSEGLEVPILDGGYKEARNFFIDHTEKISPKLNVLIISGPTGSAKTHLVKEAMTFFPTVDLEFLANHKGSAFGFESTPQSPQAQFENNLSLNLLKVLNKHGNQQPLLLEDESRLIGKNVIPEKLFLRMRESPILWVDESLEQRIENIFKDYISDSAIGRGSQEEALQLYDRYDNSLQSIQRNLGGLKTQEIGFDLTMARQAYINKKDLVPNRVWIEKLLVHYYDPLYLGSLERRNPKIQFKGTKKEVLAYLREFGFKESDITHR